jgi:hypothetical protein
MSDKVSLTNEELQAAVTAGLFHDPSVLDKLDTDSRQRYVQLAPAEGPRMSAPAADAPVTVGDLQDNPREAMKRIGQIVKRDVSDPKLWLGLAASYFGPKMLNVALPIVARAAAGAKAGLAAIPPSEVVGMISPRLGHAVRVGQAMRGAMPAEPAVPPQAPASSMPSASELSPLELTRQLNAAYRAAHAPTSPVESVSGGTPLPVDPPLSGSTPEAATALPKPKSPQQLLNEEALARRRAALQTQPTQVPEVLADLSPAEIQVYQRLRTKGVPEAVAKMEILGARRAAQQMNQTFGLKTPTEADTKFPKGMRGKVPAPKGSGS